MLIKSNSSKNLPNALIKFKLAIFSFSEYESVGTKLAKLNLASEAVCKISFFSSCFKLSTPQCDTPYHLEKALFINCDSTLAVSISNNETKGTSKKLARVRSLSSFGARYPFSFFSFS